MNSMGGTGAALRVRFWNRLRVAKVREWLPSVPPMPPPSAGAEA
jgi:hypothetical protein